MTSGDEGKVIERCLAYKEHGLGHPRPIMAHILIYLIYFRALRIPSPASELGTMAQIAGLAGLPVRRHATAANGFSRRARGAGAISAARQGMRARLGPRID